MLFFIFQTNQRNNRTAQICKEGLKETDTRQIYGGGGGGGATYVFKVQNWLHSATSRLCYLNKQLFFSIQDLGAGGVRPPLYV